MIDSVTIFSKTGLILYHYCSNTDNKTQSSSPSSSPSPNDVVPSLQTTINTFLSLHLQSPTQTRITLSNQNTISEWYANDDYMIVILYPQIVLDQSTTATNRKGGLGIQWIQGFLQDLMKEFILFQEHSTDVIQECHMFNKTFVALYEHAEAKGRQEKNVLTSSNNNLASMNSNTTKFKKKKGKEDRVWHDGEQKVTSKTMAKLDRSKRDDISEVYNDDPMFLSDKSPALIEARAAYLPSDDEVPLWEQDESLIDNDIDDDDGTNNEIQENSWGSSLKGMMDQFSGKVLSDQDLDKPLEEMEKMLKSKNVATEIAKDICNTVRKKLVGKRMASFTRVKTAVRQALEVAIEKILRPGRGRGGSEDVDLLRDVVSKREGGGLSSLFGAKSSSGGKKPYVIVMVGINGVGKSTSLAKIAYYLKSNNCNPLLAACDTFRSGAVEQLNVHAKCLNVPLYQKGYAKDPASVAKDAINHATKEGNDVVLVDTAGRMQNNLPLMKALSNLVVQNDPDLVLFVCEALVGNDGMDQLDMFNKALKSGGHNRRIDGIVLTKFDTVSDKVGAALTMTQVTGAPVVFIGTGQKYNHLKKLSVQSVIKTLFT